MPGQPHQTRRGRPAALAGVFLALAIAAVVAAVLASGGSGQGTAGGMSLPTDQGTVVHLVDGDTLDVELAGGVERVRLIGIDTPESVAPDRPVECFGPEASAWLRTAAPEGTVVRLELDAEARDRFGRLLAYVYRVEDGVFLNEAIAAAGNADVLSIPPNTAYADRIGTAMREARAAGLGLWGACPSDG